MSRQEGFTIVELLAALVIGAMLLVAIGWNLAAVIRLLPEPAGQARRQQLALAAPRLEALIEQAQPEGFEGNADHLSLIVPPPLAAGPAGPLRMTLAVVQDGGDRSLVARFAPVDDGVAWRAAAREAPVAQGYRAIRFDYVPAPAGSARRLPLLVTLSLDDGETISRISAAPRIDSDGSCRFDPISMTCRP
ncbi:PulJ/GspJ family protein [Sphingosinicella terrae]|uniref:PulJ/GspJ family protein n=1 Tax=Sphingosinicella terrae TaxID=2172047 RepID=UPI000E0DCCA5|nr:type II secretion system protein [Sphingosinicella terrae]